jgi:hypothetical protein
MSSGENVTSLRARLLLKYPSLRAIVCCAPVLRTFDGAVHPRSELTDDQQSEFERHLERKQEQFHHWRHRFVITGDPRELERLAWTIPRRDNLLEYYATGSLCRSLSGQLVRSPTTRLDELEP